MGVASVMVVSSIPDKGTTTTLRITAVKFNLSRLAGAEINRRETASYDETRQVNFAFSFHYLFAFWHVLAQVA